MNRCIDEQNRSQRDLHSLRMVDAGIAPAHQATEQKAIPEFVLKRAEARLTYDQSAGWPPRLAGERRECLTGSGGEISFGLEVQRTYLKAALKHPEVVSQLVGRWETLAVHLVIDRAVKCSVDVRAAVCLYNYSANQLIEAIVDDGVVTSVRYGEPYEHPEAPVEMAQAIGLASAHPQIKEKVEGLAAHAILRVPMDASVPNYRHRCLLVMYTDQDDPHRELPVLFSALVDLCEQRVLAFGDCPCCTGASHGSDVGHGHQHEPTNVKGPQHGRA